MKVECTCNEIKAFIGMRKKESFVESWVWVAKNRAIKNRSLNFPCSNACLIHFWGIQTKRV